MFSRFSFILIALIALAVGGVFLLPLVGPGRDLPPEMFWSIYWKFRFPRALLALVVGSGLALAGLVFQAMFRNPLATPYTLGVASGASFGAAVCLQGGFRLGLPVIAGSFLGVALVSWGAFGGALLAMLVVFGLSRSKDTSSEQMLLAGVAVNFFFSSLIILLQYVSAPHDALAMLRWTMGSVQHAMVSDSLRLGPLVLLALVGLIYFARELNVIVTGKERARSLGINVDRLRTLLFVGASLLVGAVVAATGPIGFVGLMIPHISRRLVGPNHLRLVPVTFLLGGLFLATCDTVARTALFPAELPVGVITSLLGGPFFLWLLLKAEKRLG